MTSRHFRRGVRSISYIVNSHLFLCISVIMDSGNTYYRLNDFDASREPHIDGEPQ